MGWMAVGFLEWRAHEMAGVTLGIDTTPVQHNCNGSARGEARRGGTLIAIETFAAAGYPAFFSSMPLKLLPGLKRTALARRKFTS